MATKQRGSIVGLDPTSGPLEKPTGRTLAARPKTMIEGAALASLPKTPVRPKNSAPICRAPRAVR